MIFSDSLSVLQALENLKNRSFLFTQIQDMLHKIDVDQKEAFFLCGFLDILVFLEMRLLKEVI